MGKNPSDCIFHSYSFDNEILYNYQPCKSVILSPRERLCHRGLGVRMLYRTFILFVL